MIIVAWAFVGPVTRLVVPAYAGAIPAMRWALLIPLVSSFQAINSVFNVARRQDLYIVAIVLGMVAYAGSLFLLTRHGVSLVAFPQAMLIGRAFYMVISYLFILRLRSKELARAAP